jgi:hypothetical protein
VYSNWATLHIHRTLTMTMMMINIIIIIISDFGLRKPSAFFYSHLQTKRNMN